MPVTSKKVYNKSEISQRNKITSNGTYMENSNFDPSGKQTPELPPGRWYHRKGWWIAGALLAIAVIVGLIWQHTASQVLRKQSSNAPAQPVIQSNYQEQAVSLSDVPNYENVLKKYGLTLSAGQQQFLDQNKFLLVDINKTNLNYQSPRYSDEMLAYFDQLGGNFDEHYRTPADTILVTPDIVLHAYHKFFDIALKDIEEHQLTVELTQFVRALYENADAQMKQHSGTARDHYQKILAQVTVARVLLENQAPPKPDYFQTPADEANYQKLDSQDDYAHAQAILAKYSSELGPDLAAAASEELKNIYAASDVTPSPLFGSYNTDIQADYTQYTPRSHYTENSALRAYFRTMMYFGRSAYYFKTNDGITDAALVDSLMGMADSIGVKPVDPWNKIVAITTFFAGQNDDIGYNEVNPWISRVLGSGQTAVANADAGAINQLAANVWQLPQPQILSDVIVSPEVPNMTKNDFLRSTVGFRIFGQKFTFDAWLYSQLTAGQEKSVPKLPSTPSALFVPAALGDSRAKDYAGQFLKESAGFSDAEVSAFEQKLDQQAAALAKVPQDQWDSSLGTKWLDVLSTLTQSYGQNYPQYMQSPYFPNKQIQTFLGSYSELKHDTLLYAKQSYAELGGGGGDDNLPLPPVAKGFVEPNLAFWNKLGDFVSLTQKMFSENGLGQSQMMSRLTEFQKQVAFYTKVAGQELQNQPISDDDYETLRTEQLSYMAQPLENMDNSDPAWKQSALVADVHTDALTQHVLYEATGQPYLMLAIVSNGNSPRLTAGVAYSHYEFTGPLGGNRMTDEDWKKEVYGTPPQLPPVNFWYRPLIVGSK